MIIGSFKYEATNIKFKEELYDRIITQNNFYGISSQAVG